MSAWLSWTAWGKTTGHRDKIATPIPKFSRQPRQCSWASPPWYFGRGIHCHGRANRDGAV